MYQKAKIQQHAHRNKEGGAEQNLKPALFRQSACSLKRLSLTTGRREKAPSERLTAGETRKVQCPKQYADYRE